MLAEADLKNREARRVETAGEARLDSLLDSMRRSGRARRGRHAAESSRTHVQANIDGSDRYSLSLPGTIDNGSHRSTARSSNVTVAGDWTACGLDAGCVEAAVMSGMLAAHAITGKRPTLESIIGYDHP